MAVVFLTTDDNNIPVDFSVSDQTGAVVDLSNTSNNTFQMWETGSLINITNSSMSLQSATGGVARYVFVTADTQKAGTFNAQLSLFYKAGNASGREITVGNIQVIITGEAYE